jgi:uncharacterized membrane-anchored protein
VRNLPRIDQRYWLSLSAASVFGTNTGDFVAGYLHIGHLAGLPWLAALFAAILLAEKYVARASALYFWAAIITVRTAATNVGDAFHDFGFGFAVSIPIVLVLFVASVWLYALRAPRPDPSAATVRVNAAYWGCMMLAGVLGTIGGDYASFGLHLTPAGAAIAFALLIYLSIRALGPRGMLLAPAGYWFTVALIRIGGTAGGDAFAHALRLLPSTLLTGFVFIGLVIWFYRRPAVNQVAQYDGAPLR